MKCGKPFCACVGTCFAMHSPLRDEAPVQAQSEPVGTPATRIYGSADCTMAVFDAKDVPVGTRLYTHPAPVQQEPIQVSKVYWEGDKLMAVPARATNASAEVGFNGLTQEETNNSMSVRGLSK